MYRGRPRLGASREPRRSLPVVPLIANQRYYGEAPARLRRSSRVTPARRRMCYGVDSIQPGQARAFRLDQPGALLWGLTCWDSTCCITKQNRRSENIAGELADIHAAERECRKKRIPVILGPVESSVCWMMLIADLEGNFLILHQRKNGTAG